MDTIYIAGPMRGYPRYNFDAFDAAAADLASRGWRVISPAEMDRAEGFDPDGPATPEFLAAALRRDVLAIVDSADALALLPGWERSTGAQGELALARWKSIPAYRYPAMTPVDGEDILAEALRLTTCDRQASYGPPNQDFTRTAAMWTAMFGHRFESRHVAMAMIAVKLSREAHHPKRDNWVDIAGYARCGSLCRASE